MKPSLVVLASLVSLHTHRVPSLSPGAKAQAVLPVESTPVRNERAVWDANRYCVRITGIHQRVVRTSAWNEVTAVSARHDGRWRYLAYHATRATSHSG